MRECFSFRRLTDTYRPFFYILPRNEQDGQYLFHILSQQSAIKKVSWEENKFTNLFEEGVKHRLICVFPETVQYYITLLKKLEKDNRVKQFFNTDLSHVQQYLFHKLKIEPTSKVEVQYDGSKLVELTKLDEDPMTISCHLLFQYSALISRHFQEKSVQKNLLS